MISYGSHFKGYLSSRSQSQEHGDVARDIQGLDGQIVEGDVRKWCEVAKTKDSPPDSIFQEEGMQWSTAEKSCSFGSNTTVT
jgi:hypothetical protein